MKTILVDAWNTLVTAQGLDQKLWQLLEQYPNPKIILTNANPEEQIELGLVNLPYPLYSLNHQPNKTDSNYFTKFLTEHQFSADDVIYFEHNPEAVEAAKSMSICSYHFDHITRDLEQLQIFLNNNS